MPDRFSRLRGIVWTAVFAIATGLVSVVVALCGASVQVTQSVAVSGLILATLATRQ